jgi:hypothetical protein
MSESVFLAEGERFVPTNHARGPWDPQALHGGAPAALMTTAFERVEPGAELPIARLGFELLRPIPFVPLSISTRIVRPGRRVQELAGELLADLGSAGEQLIARASALRACSRSRRACQECRRPGTAQAWRPLLLKAPIPIGETVRCPGPTPARRCASRSMTPIVRASRRARWRCGG